MNIPFIKYTKLWLAISLLTVVVCLYLLMRWGLKPGIDFTGGSLLELSYSQSVPANEAIQKQLQEFGLKDIVMQRAGTNEIIIRTNFLSEQQHQDLIKLMRDKFQTKENLVREQRFETIGSVVSQQLRQRALWAIIVVILGIVAYMAYAFRKVSRPVASWKYGAAAIVALVHDVILVMGVFAVLGHYLGVEVDTAFVVALLTVLGFSVNDTIVVFDRIRENLLHRTAGSDFGATVNNGLNQTLMRSINTTLTVLLPLASLYFLGGETIRFFALALFIGMASGAYSSIFIASPLLALTERWQRKSV